MKEQLFFIGAKGLIRNNRGQVLLLLADVSNHSKNIDPYWDIPGGRVQKGGTILDTLIREIQEEIGITVKPEGVKQILGTLSNHNIPLSGGDKAGLYLVIYSLALPDDTPITLSEEHLRHEWVSPEEAKQRLSAKYTPEFTDLL